MKKRRLNPLFTSIVGFAGLLLLGMLAVAIVRHGNTTKTGSIQGTVTLYPIGPVCKDRGQCSRPAAGQLVELRRLNGAIAASTSADSRGQYVFRVQPGTYNLVVPADRYGRPGTNIPNPIQVTQATVSTVNVTIDTAIR